MKEQSMTFFENIVQLEELKIAIQKKSKKELEELEKEKKYIQKHELLKGGTEATFEIRKEFYQRGISDCLKEIETLQRKIREKEEKEKKE